MKLISNASTPQEARSEIVELLKFRATQERFLTTTTNNCAEKKRMIARAEAIEAVMREIVGVDCPEGVEG